MNFLNDLKQNYKKLDIFDHHLCHAASAYYFSNFNNSFILTIDGWGDHASSKLFFASSFDSSGNTPRLPSAITDSGTVECHCPA